MGSGQSKPEEIVIQQQQQQQQPLTDSGIGPMHVIATCMIVLLIAIFLKVVWRIIMREVETRPRRAQSLANIV